MNLPPNRIGANLNRITDHRPSPLPPSGRGAGGEGKTFPYSFYLPIYIQSPPYPLSMPSCPYPCHPWFNPGGGLGIFLKYLSPRPPRLRGVYFCCPPLLHSPQNRRRKAVGLPSPLAGLNLPVFSRYERPANLPAGPIFLLTLYGLQVLLALADTGFFVVRVLADILGNAFLDALPLEAF